MSSASRASVGNRRVAACGAAIVCLAGCHVSLTPSVSPTIDTRAKAGFEARTDLRWGLGEHGRVEQVVGGGAGYRPELGAYGVVVTALSIALDHHREEPPMIGTLAWGAAAAFGEDGTQASGRVMTELFGLVAETESAEKRGEGHMLFLGPQLLTGFITARDPAGDPEVRGLFGLGLAFNWKFLGGKPKPRASDAPEAQPAPTTTPAPRPTP